MLARLAASLLLLLTPGGHPPPTVYVETDIAEGEILCNITGEIQVWNAWVQTEMTGEFILTEEEIDTVAQRALVLFAERNAVSIDGERIVPTLAGAETPEDYSGVPSISVFLRYACDGEPSRVDFQWEVFEETDWFERRAIPAMIRYRGDLQQAVFSEDEPEFIWHTREIKPRARPSAVTVDTPPPLHLLLPIGSIGVLCAVLAFLPIARRLRLSRRLRWLTLIGGIVVAVLARNVLTVPVAKPWGGVELPTATAAERIFETLHGNIYRAFDARSEQEIYDLLAVSVGPRVLDELYADVYESLILRGQGGAVCKIENVDHQQKDVTLRAEADIPSFDVDCAWRVHGVVAHWGHEHRRMNEYRAKYTVRHDGASWKIDNVTILEHKRIDEDG